MSFGSDSALTHRSPSRPRSSLRTGCSDTSGGPERRASEALFVHGYLLKPGDVARTDWRVRCAQPPYDGLPVSRASIPAGVVLSREGDAWIGECGVEDVALPLYEGRMIGQFDSSQKGWVSGKGRGAVWREISWNSKQIEPQFLMKLADYESAAPVLKGPKITHMRVASATNARTAIGVLICSMPGGDKAAMFYLPGVSQSLALTATLNSVVFDYATRFRLAGLGLDYHVLAQNPLPKLPKSVHSSILSAIVRISGKLCLTAHWSASQTLELQFAAPASSRDGNSIPALTNGERLRLRVILDALVAASFDLGYEDIQRILDDCDHPSPISQTKNFNPKGFWRVERRKDPEIRHSVLTLVAFRDLEMKIQAEGGRERGIRAFVDQNHGEGWMLPETLRLADYNLGHDERAQHPQTVAGRLGPRFYDWQLVQSPEESWQECHLHARNLLNADGYRSLIVDLLERRAAEDGAFVELLTDRYVRRLLGDDGYVTVLANILAQGILDEHVYWTTVDQDSRRWPT